MRGRGECRAHPCHAGVQGCGGLSAVCGTLGAACSLLLAPAPLVFSLDVSAAGVSTTVCTRFACLPRMLHSTYISQGDGMGTLHACRLDAASRPRDCQTAVDAAEPTLQTVRDGMYLNAQADHACRRACRRGTHAGGAQGWACVVLPRRCNGVRTLIMPFQQPDNLRLDQRRYCPSCVAAAEGWCLMPAWR